MYVRNRGRKMSRTVAKLSPQPSLRAKMIRKLPREMLRDLRMRAGLTAAEVARHCKYASTSGYNQYELEPHGEKLIPYKLVKQLLPLFVGKGSPPITGDELIEITEARSIKLDLPRPADTVAGNRLLVVRYRVEPGVYIEKTAAGTKSYGEAGIAPAFDVEANAQFAAVVADDPKRTILHCVKPAQVGAGSRKGRSVVCLVPRGNSDLVEVLLKTYDDKGEVPGATPVGVIIGRYSRE